jgi:2-oxoglutarate ferredoxin oxidoreductase subunit gamma
VISADITITMSQESFDRYGASTRPGSVLFVDADLVTAGLGSSGGTVYRVPATKIAADEFKKTLAANMVMLGAVAAVTKIVRLESLKMSVREVAPKASSDLNTRALERGFEWAVANLKKS